MSLVFRPATFYPVRYAPTLFRYHCAPPVQHYPYASAQSFFNLFDESFNQIERAMTQLQTQFKRPFSPKFNVTESNRIYTVEGELPGFDAKDLSIEFLDEGHTLQIKGKAVQGGESAQKTVASNETPAVEGTPATTTEPETASIKSHQATVEDEVEQPANSSAVAESSPQASTQPAPQAANTLQTTSEPAKHQDQQVSESSSTSTFTRTFKFPSQIDQEAVKASLKNGILAITLPFVRKPEIRKIQIE